MTTTTPTALSLISIVLLCQTGSSFWASADSNQIPAINREPRATHNKCDSRFWVLSSTHTACLTPPKRKYQGLKWKEKHSILYMHNKLRGYVGEGDGQQTAADMQAMVWDEELASLAQKWASNCLYQHDDRLSRTIPGKYSTGQNIAWTTIYDWEFTVNAWKNEVGNFRFGVGSINGGLVGHYTQMVWATTSRLGCGYAFCNGSRHFYVCNYGPTGNMAIPDDPSTLYKPYTPGPRGSACVNTYNSRTGLCDCGGKTCYNGGTLDVNTCQCKCPKRAWIDKHNDCALDCSKAEDMFICRVAGGPWGFDKCRQAVNIAYDYCPVTCRWCPVKGNTYWGVGDVDDYGELSDSPAMMSEQAPTDREEEEGKPDLKLKSKPKSKQESKPKQKSKPKPKPKLKQKPKPKPKYKSNPKPKPKSKSKSKPKPKPKPNHKVATTKPTEQEKPKSGRPVCTRPEPAKCGQPNKEGYWPRTFCSNKVVAHLCPAMCGQCLNKGCDDYSGNHHYIGQRWTTPYGRLSCTLDGVKHETGCVKGDIFIEAGNAYKYDEGKYRWECSCRLVNSQHQLECIGSLRSS